MRVWTKSSSNRTLHLVICFQWETLHLLGLIAFKLLIHHIQPVGSRLKCNDHIHGIGNNFCIYGQCEYKRGISGWNFNLDDMKAQASLVYICFPILIRLTYLIWDIHVKYIIPSWLLTDTGWWYYSSERWRSAS